MAQAHSFLGPLLALVLVGPGAPGRAVAAEPAKKPAASPSGGEPKRKTAGEAAKKAAPPAKPGSLPAAPVKGSGPGAAPKPGSIPAAPAKPGSIPRAPGATVATAEPAPALKPPAHHNAQGTRKVEPVRSAAPATGAAPPAPAPVARKGKAPAKPQATLPPGTPPKAPDAATRRQIAAGPTDEDVRAGKDDPELAKLREAERVLFPRPLPGVSAGWSWDLPQATVPETEVSTSGLPPEVSGRPPLPVARDADWLRGLTLPNLPLRYDERVVKYLKFYRDSQSGRAIARVWAKKSGRYQAALRSALSRAGLPTDLVWLSLIESGHNPTIVSPAGAVGLWQFMPETARIYGLTVDRWVDERMDPERSTQAAVRFLSDLYRRFGSWDLAMAAYNMGHGGLSRAVKKYNTNDFWELARHEAGMPWETSLYVPKILATAILMNNKKAFGLDGIEPDPAESFGTIEVGPGLAFSELAGSLGVEPSALERLNPAYLAGRTPPAAPGRASPTYPVRVPPSAKAGRVLLSSEREQVVSVVVRQGDTPASLARANRTSEAALRSLNRIGSQEVLAAGTVLLVPRGVAPDPDPPEDDVVVIARDVEPPVDSVRVFYPVCSGDTLSSVAASFGVAISDLVAWNALDGSARLQDGMVLQVFPKQSHDLSRVRVLKQGAVRVLLAGSPGFFDYFEGLNGRRRLIVTAKSGDTLASIGKRYAMSVGSMERINRRSRSDRLSAGETVVVYADRGKHPQPVHTPSTVPLPPAVVAGSVASLEDTNAPNPTVRTGGQKAAARAVP